LLKGRPTDSILRLETGTLVRRLSRDGDGERVAHAMNGAYSGERVASIGFAHLESVREGPASRVAAAARDLVGPWGDAGRIELRSLRRPVRRMLLEWAERDGDVTVLAAARRKLVLVPGSDSRRALEASLSPTRRKMLRLAERDGSHCVWCSTPLTYRSLHATLDHVRCRSHGGADALDNLVLACAPCNHRRADAPASLWLEACLARGARVDLAAAQAAIVRSAHHHGRVGVAALRPAA
jgi:5-methylcytosine-specific restriction endonuclease McrA